MRAAVVFSACIAASLASQQTLDCPLRQLGVDFAQKLQPWRPAAAFQEVADALNGAVEAQNCSVAPQASASSSASAASSRVLSFPLPAAAGTAAAPVFFVDASSRSGDVSGDGSRARPFQSLPHALGAIRASRARAGVRAARDAPQATLVLRAGTFHLGLSGTLQLTPADSRVTLQAFPGEAVFISGGVPLNGLSWTAVAPPARAAYEYRSGALAAGFDVAPAATMTVAAAQALCDTLPLCAGVSFASADPNPSAPVLCAFKYNVFWAPAANSGVLVKNVGYAAGATPALYSADVSSYSLGEINALRASGVRMIRARYPNAPTVELLGAMQIVAQQWTRQPMGTNADYTFEPAQPSRNDSAQGFFQQFKLGVGGPCAQRFTPAASYWCSNTSQGGGPGPYQAPVGMTTTNAPESLPHTPYAGNVSRAVVHSWRAGRWFSWAFRVDTAQFDAASNTTVFNFSLSEGGNQGSRGGDAGQEFMLENVLDELDAPGEFYYDAVAQKLYLWSNASAAAPADGTLVAAHLPVIINATGTQADPVTDVGFLGLGFRDAAPHYLGPHGTPSGGDWAVSRAAALFFEGTVGATVDGCFLTALDGNAIFISGYARNASITRNEMLGIGETAVSQWGYTDGSPVPGMGFDATAGNQPRGTLVQANFVHEVGLWMKQNSAYFQSESFGNTISQNIFFNGPRAGVNFDDGMGGGSLVSDNLIFNMCRESSDHGPFNSWNRQVYLVDSPSGPTTAKLNDTISGNLMWANYHSSMAIDNDDGSAYYNTIGNVFISASEGAAYGGNSLKSDFGGHDNFHVGNLDLFWSRGFGICGQLDGHADAYANNILYLAADGDYGSGQACIGSAGQTIVGNNTIYSPTGAISECGKTLTAYQAAGGDPLSTGSPYPADSVILGIARNLLGM